MSKSKWPWVKGDDLAKLIASEYPKSTPEERQWAARVTGLRSVVVEGLSEAHTTWLVVESQQFRLDGYSDTLAEAAFVAWMLAKAMLKIHKSTGDAADYAAEEGKLQLRLHENGECGALGPCPYCEEEEEENSDGDES